MLKVVGRLHYVPTVLGRGPSVNPLSNQVINNEVNNNMELNVAQFSRVVHSLRSVDVL